MIDQSKIEITSPAVDRALVFQYEDMLTGKSSRLSWSQCMQLGGKEILKVRLLPDGRVPQICFTSGLEGLCLVAASGPTARLTCTRSSSIAVVKLTSSCVDSPPQAVGKGEPPRNDDRADVVLTRTEGLSINDPQSVCLRIGLKLTEMLMHVLPVGHSHLQGKWDRLSSHKAWGRVDNDSIEMGSGRCTFCKWAAWKLALIGERNLNIGTSK